MDNAAVHYAKKLTIPENIALYFLPAYCPELNPAERVWQYLKDRCANIVFDSLGTVLLCTTDSYGIDKRAYHVNHKL